MSDQFGRKVALYLYAPPKIVAGQAEAEAEFGPEPAVTSGKREGQILDLSQMQIRFLVQQSDFETPNTCIARVWNLSDTTARKIMDRSGNGPEYTRYVLQAGYVDGSFGVIFDGTIKQVRRGRFDAVDTFLDIWGGDGDLAYNYAIVNGTLQAPTKQSDIMKVYQQSFAAAQSGANVSYSPDLSLGPVLPRGKVLFGMAKDGMRDLAATNNVTWSFQDGTIQINSQTGYLPGEAVVLTSKTGLLDLPQQTSNGIAISCLLNPKLKIGGLVKIDNKSIQTQLVDPRIQFGTPNNLAFVSDDGFYKILVAEHTGDTRGNEWETKLTCLAVDVSAGSGNQVKPYAG